MGNDQPQLWRGRLIDRCLDHSLPLPFGEMQMVLWGMWYTYLTVASSIALCPLLSAKWKDPWPSVGWSTLRLLMSPPIQLLHRSGMCIRMLRSPHVWVFCSVYCRCLHQPSHDLSASTEKSPRSCGTVRFLLLAFPQPIPLALLFWTSATSTTPGQGFSPPMSPTDTTSMEARIMTIFLYIIGRVMCFLLLVCASPTDVLLFVPLFPLIFYQFPRSLTYSHSATCYHP